MRQSEAIRRRLWHGGKAAIDTQPSFQAGHLGGHVQVDDKVLGRHRPEKHIQVPPSQPQRLGASSGELDVVAGRYRPTDAIHSALQDLVLERERCCKQAQNWRTVTVPTGRFLRSRKDPAASTVTTATSPSLLDRFHSSTLKCLNTLRKGCCQAAEGTPPEHRSGAARRDPPPPPAGRASARGPVTDAAGTSDPGLPGREP
jgi:hypothetical protein